MRPSSRVATEPSRSRHAAEAAGSPRVRPAPRFWPGGPRRRATRPLRPPPRPWACSPIWWRRRAVRRAAVPAPLQRGAGICAACRSALRYATAAGSLPPYRAAASRWPRSHMCHRRRGRRRAQIGPRAGSRGERRRADRRSARPRCRRRRPLVPVGAASVRSLPAWARPGGGDRARALAARTGPRVQAGDAAPPWCSAAARPQPRPAPRTRRPSFELTSVPPELVPCSLTPPPPLQRRR